MDESSYRIYSINRPGRLLIFGPLEWALIRGWALIRINTVFQMIVPACTTIQTIWIFWDAYCPDISVIAKIRQFCNRFEILILTQLILKMRHSLR